MPKLTSTITLSIPGLGEVIITPRRNATRITLRASTDGSMRASVPYGIATNTLLRRLREMIPRLQKRISTTSSAPAYTDGWSYRYAEGSASVRYAPTTATLRHITVATRGADITITVPRTLSLSDSEVATAISTLLKKGAAFVARTVVTRQASAWAASLGISGINWQIGQGTHTLGTCYPSERRIRLSGNILFLPEQLRRFIVCHELAHLTRTDHSPAFHALCDRYCGGLERELIRELHSFRWPIIR